MLNIFTLNICVLLAVNFFNTKANNIQYFAILDNFGFQLENDLTRGNGNTNMWKIFRLNKK